MKALLSAGSVSGFIIVLGEAILNGQILAANWSAMNSQLGLSEPTGLVVSLAMIKLFALGFLLIWLFDVYSHKYGYETKSAIYAGFTIGLLIWGWTLSGLWLAGYVDNTIALLTFFWGLVELPLAAYVGSKVFIRIKGTVETSQ